MGRGGGGGGGHRSGGGSFHYSGGGRSGRGSGSSSYHRSSSSYGGYGGYYRGGRAIVNVYTGLGWRMQMITNLVITLLVCVVVVVMLLKGDGSPKSTVERTKLSASECTLIDDWYQDDVEWIFNEARLKRGLNTFYRETGVQPFLWITDNINGKSRPTASDFENAMNQKYDELFSDEGHLIVCFMESSPNTWATYAWAGDAARNVMDDEAIDILHSYFSRYYTADMEDEEYMATVFEKTGSSIMTVAKSTKAKTIVVIGVVSVFGLIAVIVIVIFAIVKKRKEQAAIDRDILNTDIGSIGDPLEDKYGDDGI